MKKEVVVRNFATKYDKTQLDFIPPKNVRTFKAKRAHV